jgi:hypothetical protein
MSDLEAGGDGIDKRQPGVPGEDVDVMEESASAFEEHGGVSEELAENLKLCEEIK